MISISNSAHEAPAPLNDESPDRVVHPPDTPYHDYLAAHRSIGEFSFRRKALIRAAAVVVSLLGVVVGVATYLYVAG